jgi:single-strand DNA-binding protein
MAIPTINDIAGIIQDPELKHTPGGKAVLNLRLAFNDSKFNEQTRKWDTVKTFYVDAQAWEHTAERLYDQLTKGDQIYVNGRIETQQWEKDGEKKSKNVLNVQTARKLAKAEAGNQQQRPQQQTPQADQWNAAPQQQQAWGNGPDSEPPF